MNFVSKQSFIKFSKEEVRQSKSQIKSLPKKKEIIAEEEIGAEAVIDETFAFFTFEDIYSNFNTINPRSGPASKMASVAEIQSAVASDEILEPQSRNSEIKRRKHKLKKQSIHKASSSSAIITNDIYFKFNRNESEMSASTASSKSKSNNRPKTIVKDNSKFYVDCLMPPNEDRYLPFSECAEFLTPNFTMRKRTCHKKVNSPRTCISCGWIFPNQMTTISINLHINLCLDGLGDLAKETIMIEAPYQAKPDILKLNEIKFPENKHFSKLKSSY